MPEFYSLRVASIEKAAEDAVCISLVVPPSLQQVFAFHAGQYVPLRRRIDGREERRTYSMVAAPGGPLLKLGVRVQPHGRVSGDLAGSLRAGDSLEVGSPLGRFRTQTDPGRVFSYVAFAAGSGITPVLSLAADILAREPASRFTLIYGNRSMARTMFLEEILALKNRYLGRFAVYFVMSREPQHTAVLNGRIDGAKVRELARQVDGVATADEYFVCGPGSMAEEIRAAIQQVNGNAPVRCERFAAGASPVHPAADAVPTAVAAQELLATVSVTMDGRTRTFPMAPGDASVLEAAERAGLELPFSCRSGICATCRVRVLQGQVTMMHNIALAPWELEAGFILCCQARPTTGVLELSYDEK
jgi:ring-1,2-phenylacetyl-CoA epoxidase subunit PaaE